MSRIRPKAPGVITFEGVGRCFYRVVGYRPPKAGEFYLSGAIPEAYLQPKDGLAPYWVVVPTYHAVVVSAEVRGDRIA